MNKFLLALSTFLVFALKGLSQTQGLIDFSTGGKSPVPEVVYTYEYKQPDGWSTNNCSYNWSTNGQSLFTTSDGNYVGDSFVKKVYIKWLNAALNDNERKVFVSVTGCDSTKLQGLEELIVNPKYLPPPTFKNAGGSTITTLNVPCYAPEITLRVESIADAVYYHWQLPVGWSKKGSPGENLFSTTTASVDVTVAQGNTNTSVGVYTSVDNFNGPSATLPITRNPDQQISFAGTNPTVYCNSSKPVTYQVTPASGFTYTWTYPSGWSCQSGCNTNSITLIPNGSNVQGQSITARASIVCSGQSSVTNTASQAITFSTAVSPDFTINGSALVCTSATYTITNASSAATWTASNSAISLNSTTGLATKIYDGGVSVNATLNCSGTLQKVTKLIWAGKPGNSFSGSTRVYPYQVNTYEATALDQASSYIWSFSPSVGNCGTTYGGNCQFGGSSNSIAIWWEENGYIELNSTNACGTGTANRKTVTTGNNGGGPGGGCEPCQRSGQSDEKDREEVDSDEILNVEGINAYPNPSKDIFTVSVEDTGRTGDIIVLHVFDNTGRLVKVVKSTTNIFQVDMRGEGTGMYLLKTLTGSKQRSLRIQKN